MGKEMQIPDWGANSCWKLLYVRQATRCFAQYINIMILFSDRKAESQISHFSLLNTQWVEQTEFGDSIALKIYTISTAEFYMGSCLLSVKPHHLEGSEWGHIHTPNVARSKSRSFTYGEVSFHLLNSSALFPVPGLLPGETSNFELLPIPPTL